MAREQILDKQLDGRGSFAVVATDGSGHYPTIALAISAGIKKIRLKNGTHIVTGSIFNIPAGVELEGETKDGVIIDATPSTRITTGTDTKISNLTFKFPSLGLNIPFFSSGSRTIIESVLFENTVASLGPIAQIKSNSIANNISFNGPVDGNGTSVFYIDESVVSNIDINVTNIPTFYATAVLVTGGANVNNVYIRGGTTSGGALKAIKSAGRGGNVNNVTVVPLNNGIYGDLIEAQSTPLNINNFHFISNASATVTFISNLVSGTTQSNISNFKFGGQTSAQRLTVNKTVSDLFYLTGGIAGVYNNISFRNINYNTIGTVNYLFKNDGGLAETLNISNIEFIDIVVSAGLRGIIFAGLNTLMNGVSVQRVSLTTGGGPFDLESLVYMDGVNSIFTNFKFEVPGVWGSALRIAQDAGLTRKNNRVSNGIFYNGSNSNFSINRFIVEANTNVIHDITSSGGTDNDTGTGNDIRGILTATTL